MFDEPSVALVGIVPVLVVEIVPARPLPKGSAEPDRVVEIVPALVVEMVPALVVEMVPVFAADVVDTVRIKVAVQAIHLSFVIALLLETYGSFGLMRSDVTIENGCTREDFKEHATKIYFRVFPISLYATAFTRPLPDIISFGELGT